MSEMASLGALSAGDFEPHKGMRFRVPVEGGEDLELELLEVVGRQGDTVEGAERQPFSVLFRGPAERAFEQRICRLEHDAMGALDLFLVPVGTDSHGMRYEAIFS